MKCITNNQNFCPYQKINEKLCSLCKLSLYDNYYKYLENHFHEFIKKLSIPLIRCFTDNHIKKYCESLIVAHGDKTEGYKNIWEDHNIHFYHGISIYLLTYIEPYQNEVRQTNNGWVFPHMWVISNKEKFMPFLS